MVTGKRRCESIVLNGEMSPTLYYWILGIKNKAIVEQRNSASI